MHGAIIKIATPDEDSVVADFMSFIGDKQFPCTGARSALASGNIDLLVAGHMACPHEDRKILEFIYSFTERYRNSEKGIHSAVVIFKEPADLLSEALFDSFLWKKLQSLSDLDAADFLYDRRVNADPGSPDFSFSLGEEAFFVIGLHPGSSRPSRKFRYPALAFNPHDQFEVLKQEGRYDKLRSVIRQREMNYSGSLNPMLDDFGKSTEALQYSGQVHGQQWKCPLTIQHERSDSDTTA